MAISIAQVVASPLAGALGGEQYRPQGAMLQRFWSFYHTLATATQNLCLKDYSHPTVLQMSLRGGGAKAASRNGKSIGWLVRIYISTQNYTDLCQTLPPD